MVMAQALFRHIKSLDTDIAIDVLAPGWSLPIVARMPEVREGFASQTAHGELGIGRRREIAAALQTKAYSRAIVLPRSLKAALIPWLAKIPQRTGFRGEWRYGLINDMRAFDATVLDQTVKRFVALGVSSSAASDKLLPMLPMPRLRVDNDNQRRVVKQLQLDCSRPVVAMMPGAEYGPAKCWPLQHFAELARSLDDAGLSVWILGSEKDAPSGAEIAANSAALNLCGKTALADVVDILAKCTHAVSNDSGLMHVAAAVGVHVHAIYGSSSPSFTPPLTDQRHIHYLNLDCSPCFQRECPLQHLRCLKEISVESVLQEVVQNT